MKLNILFAATMLATSCLAVGGGMGVDGTNSRAAQQPMPSLMRTVKLHGDQLNLTDEQSRQLAAWHDKNHAVVHSKLDEIQAINREMQHAVIDGANRALINGYIARMDALRDEIVSTKLQCRNNMREILNDQQWQTVTRLYREKFM